MSQSSENEWVVLIQDVEGGDMLQHETGTNKLLDGRRTTSSEESLCSADESLANSILCSSLEVSSSNHKDIAIAYEHANPISDACSKMVYNNWSSITTRLLHSFDKSVVTVIGVTMFIITLVVFRRYTL